MPARMRLDRSRHSVDLLRWDRTFAITLERVSVETLSTLDLVAWFHGRNGSADFVESLCGETFQTLRLSLQCAP